MYCGLAHGEMRRRFANGGAMLNEIKRKHLRAILCVKEIVIHTLTDFSCFVTLYEKSGKNMSPEQGKEELP